MRARILVPVGTLLAAMLPMAAGASTTSGDLVLSPAQGAPGSHFTATFTFTEAPCDAYAVDFYWDPSSTARSIGGVDATGAGPTCTVSMDLTVPLTDATPNHSYQVEASAGTKQVDAGSAHATTWSTKDSGVSQFAVTSAPPPGSPGGSGPPTSSHVTTTSSSSATTGTATPPTTGQPSAGVAGTTSSDSASPSPDLAGGSSSSTGNGGAPPLGLGAPRAPAGGGMGGAIIVALALLALVIVAAWLHRTGRLGNLLRR